jgi:hypothetical protein
MDPSNNERETTMTKTPKQMLADLNVLRVEKGDKPIKAWKSSTVKLAEALAKAGGKIEAPAIAPTPSPEKVLLAEHAKAVRKTFAKAKVAKINGNHVRAVRTLGDGEVHLTSIAQQLELTPKHARAIARKHKSDIAPLQVSGKKYVFVKANVARVKAILERAE